MNVHHASHEPYSEKEALSKITTNPDLITLITRNVDLLTRHRISSVDKTLRTVTEPQRRMLRTIFLCSNGWQDETHVEDMDIIATPLMKTTQYFYEDDVFGSQPVGCFSWCIKVTKGGKTGRGYIFLNSNRLSAIIQADFVGRNHTTASPVFSVVDYSLVDHNDTVNPDELVETCMLNLAPSYRANAHTTRYHLGHFCLDIVPNNTEPISDPRSSELTKQLLTIHTHVDGRLCKANENWVFQAQTQYFTQTLDSQLQKTFGAISLNENNITANLFTHSTFFRNVDDRATKWCNIKRTMDIPIAQLANTVLNTKWGSLEGSDHFYPADHDEYMDWIQTLQAKA